MSVIFVFKVAYLLKHRNIKCLHLLNRYKIHKVKIKILQPCNKTRITDKY